MTKAVYAGTFDPLTLGHWWMVQRAAELFDLTVAIGENPSKKHSQMFTVQERIDMFTDCLNHPVIGVANEVKIDYFSNKYLVHYAQKIGAEYIVRGIRSTKDFEFEYTMKQVNRDLSHKVETIYLIPDREVADISSSLVRGLIGPAGWQEAIKLYVPPPVFDRLVQKFGSKA